MAEKKLTKSQRYVAYVIMLCEAKELRNYNNGFCDLILMLFNMDNNGLKCNSASYDRVTEFFPELHNKRPPYFSYHWFPTTKEGWDQRIELLNQCIRETEPK